MQMDPERQIGRAFKIMPLLIAGQVVVGLGVIVFLGWIVIKLMQHFGVI